MDNPVDNLWISLGEDICLSQLGVKRLNNNFFGLLHVHSLHFMLSIESLDVKIIRICSQNFGFKVINLLCCCCFFFNLN